MDETAELEARLAAATRFGRLVRVRACASTQDLATSPEARGDLIVWADEQSEGRGRKGRGWHGAPARAVELTFRVEGLELDEPALMATAAPTTFVPALERALGGRLTLKWPNDLLHGGRKLSGVLIDALGNPVRTWLIGIGINVNRTEFPPELRDSATSLALATGRSTDRAELVVELASELERSLRELESGELGRLTELFRDRMGCVGREVHLSGSSIDTRGRLVALDLRAAHLESGRTVPLAQLGQLRRV